MPNHSKEAVKLERAVELPEHPSKVSSAEKTFSIQSVMTDSYDRRDYQNIASRISPNDHENSRSSSKARIGLVFLAASTPLSKAACTVPCRVGCACSPAKYSF